MDMVILGGLTEALSKDIGKMTKYVDLAYINLRMDTNTKGNLWMIKCMVKVHTGGLMGKFIKETTKIIKNMVTANFLRQMALNTTATGKMT